MSWYFLCTLFGLVSLLACYVSCYDYSSDLSSADVAVCRKSSPNSNEVVNTNGDIVLEWGDFMLFRFDIFSDEDENGGGLLRNVNVVNAKLNISNRVHSNAVLVEKDWNKENVTYKSFSTKKTSAKKPRYIFSFS
mmetsp:Transcript_13094/g.14511  ORF Transcript_13094/g.14511 Transcript_13094/m.14511 type:complete len:135 (+) Transcript_13094:13-417(+)